MAVEDRHPRWRAPAIVLLVFVLLAVMFITARSRDGLTVLERLLRDGLAPVETVLSVATYHVRDAASQWRTLRSLQEENRELRNRVAELTARNQLLEEAWRENALLRSLLGLVESRDETLVPAVVIGRPVSNWWSQVTINRGRRHGIAAPMPVLTSEGVVGRVISVTETTAEVLLLIDPKSAVGAIVRRTSEPVVVEGVAQGPTRLRLRALVAGSDLQVGDVVVTSRFSRIFPPGMTIGRIAEVAPSQPGRAAEAWVEPVVDFDRLEVVAVLAHTPPALAPADREERSAAAEPASREGGEPEGEGKEG